MSAKDTPKSQSWTSHRGYDSYFEPRPKSMPSQSNQDTSWPRQPSSQSRQDPSCNKGIQKDSGTPLSFVPPDISEIMMEPPKLCIDLFPDCRIVCGRNKLRNDDFLKELLSIDFMRNEPYGPAIKFLTRILLGMMTLSEWYRYYDAFGEAKVQLSYKGPREFKPTLRRLSGSLSYFLRHCEEKMELADNMNAVNILFIKETNILGEPEAVMRLVMCIIANDKQRFDCTIKIKEPRIEVPTSESGHVPSEGSSQSSSQSINKRIVEIFIFAFQGHTCSSLVFDHSTLGREISTLGDSPCVLGIIYHVTGANNATSIKRMGLLSASPTEANNKKGRLAIHFLFTSKDPSLRGAGTKKEVRQPIYVLFDIRSYVKDFPKEKIYLSHNGVLQVFSDRIEPKYLKVVKQHPEDIEHLLKENTIEEPMRVCLEEARMYLYMEMANLGIDVDQYNDPSLSKSTAASSSQPNDPSLGQTGRPASSSQDHEEAAERFRQSARKEKIPVMKNHQPENMTKEQVSRKVKAQFPIIIDEIEEVPRPKSPKDLDDDYNSDVEIEIIGDLHEEATVIDPNSCTSTTWVLLDEGFFWDREKHPDLPLKERKVIKLHTADHRLWKQNWRDLDQPVRIRFRKLGYSSTNWKAAPFSGIAVDFLFSAWLDAKHFVYWTKKRTHNFQSEEQKNYNIRRFGNSEFDYFEFFNLDPSSIEDLTPIEKEKIDEDIKNLMYDWKNTKEVFIQFLLTAVNKYNCTETTYTFVTPTISNILKTAADLKPIHPWVINIYDSLISHADRVIDLEEKRLFEEEVQEYWEKRNPSWSAPVIEELEPVSMEVDESSTDDPSSKPKVEVKTEPTDDQNNEFMDEVDWQNDENENESSKQPDQEKSLERSAEEEKQDERARLFATYLESFIITKSLPVLPPEKTIWRRLDANYGIMGKDIHLTHSFELQFNSWRNQELKDMDFIHPHQQFPWEIEKFMDTWNFNADSWFHEMPKNKTFEIDEDRSINIETARVSKEKIDERNRRIQYVVDDYYKSYEQGINIERKILLSRILEAGFQAYEVADEDREKGFNSTVSLNVMTANLGNFARSRKSLHPRMSNTALQNAVQADIPEESIFVRLLEGMSSHLFLLCETYEVTDKEYAYLKDHAKLHSATSFNKGLTVLARGEEVKITILSDNTNSLYHQLYYRALNDEQKDDSIKIPTQVGDYTIFEIDFGIIGKGHTPRRRPFIYNDPSKASWTDNVQRNRLFTAEAPASEGKKLSRANMNKVRVCIFHLHNEVTANNTARTGEFLFHLWEECLRLQVDILGGDGNSAVYRFSGNKQKVPNPRKAVFQLIGRELQTFHNGHVSEDQFIDISFVSSNSSYSIQQNFEFWNLHGEDIVKGKYDYDWEDMPDFDTMISAVISYGHSFDRTVDNESRTKTRAKEFIIDISEGITDLNTESLFLPPSDKDSHSPIWFSIKLPEMALSKWKNAMKSSEARSRRSEVRKKKREEEPEPTQNTSWCSSDTSWKQGRTQDTSWRSSDSSSWQERPTHDTSWQSGQWQQNYSSWNDSSWNQSQYSEQSSSSTTRGRWRK